MIFRPSKSDIRQIDTLVKLGANESDICKVLNITTFQISKWKDKNTSVADLLTPKARPEFTVVHPDFAHMVEEAFTCGMKRFYRFKEEYRMATGRYKYYHSTMRELELKLSLKDLEKFIEVFETILNGGSKKKDIKMGDLWKMLFNLKSRIALAFDIETVHKLATVAYFDETEDLISWSEEYGKEKIKLWKEHNVHDFFLTRLIGELLNVNDISADFFQAHLNLMDGIKKELDFDLLEVLQGNS